MDEFSTLARDFGYRPQGKSAPMAPPSKSNSGGVRFTDDVDRFSDVFGGPPKYNTNSNNSKSASASSLSDFDYDTIFNNSKANDYPRSKPATTTSPVYDKPVYDEDIFDGLPGLKSKPMSSSARYDDDVFASISSPKNQNRSQKQSGGFDDLIGNLGRTKKNEAKNSRSSGGFDDLLPGFGSNRPLSEATRVQKTTFNATKPASAVKDDPFVVLESNSKPTVSSPQLYADPLEEISKPSNSGNTKVSGSSIGGGVFDDIGPLDGFGKSFPASSSGIENNVKDGSPSRTGSNIGRSQTSSSAETIGKSSFKDSGRHSQKMYTNNFQESNVFDMPSVSTDALKSVGQTVSASRVNAKSSEKNSQVEGVFPGSHESIPSDDIWITVSEVPLLTQPTSAPPPSRPPPPIPGRASKSVGGFSTSTARKKGTESSSSAHRFSLYSQSPKPNRPPVKSPVGSQVDELEDFAMGRARSNDDESEEVNTNSSVAAASAAAMKEAMDRAEAKFRHAKEVREREYAKTSRSKESVQLEKDEQAMPDDQEREYREREYRENSERLDHERLLREEEEREQRKLEKEREKAREIEREREKAKQAVERATREARGRAAVDARERAAAEVRLKSERAAVQRAQAEARERAATDAKERAEKAAADARERVNLEARDKEAKEKATAAAARAEAEARRRVERAAVERAAAEARERAAAAARMNQQKNDNDLESFFNVGSRPSSAPRPRENSSFQDPMPDPRFQNKGGPEGTRKTSSVGASSNVRKPSPSTNIVDDLSSIFGAAPSSGQFQDVEGETEERRRARLERHQRTQERAAKALAEKNQRDLQTQRDQDERHRIAETLDVEIKRWAAGKEGNLRALLSTMQYVLWPECGWQPVSLTDLITGASVKKVYRKATLCIHPDKVQQKGATLQQKYIAEKVFDLLKEAWNKFNSEELF